MMKSQAGKLEMSIERWEQHLKQAQELDVATEIQFAKIMLKQRKAELGKLGDDERCYSNDQESEMSSVL